MATPGGDPAHGTTSSRGPPPRRHRHAGADTWAPVPNRVPGAKAFAVSAGKHAKFRCYVTGKPKPEIVWQKDGKPLVLYCKPQDQGLYVCTASNTAGQTLSAVQLQVKGRCMPGDGLVGSGFFFWRGGSSPQHPCCGQPPGTAPHGPDLARGAPGRG
uniref:Ig-like domain-containing protein n=1 Tax=Anser cygnoides TaxID=8845 RepID=A0A8B9EC22_ANSCY